MSPTKQQLLTAIEVAPDAVLEEVLVLLQQRLNAPVVISEPAGAEPASPSDLPLWAIAEAVRQTVPAEAWATVPTDLSTNFDHYQKRHHQT